MTTSHEDRCVGCLLGTACGDILGAAVEGFSASEIRKQHGELRDFAEIGPGSPTATIGKRKGLPLGICQAAARPARVGESEEIGPSTPGTPGVEGHCMDGRGGDGS